MARATIACRMHHRRVPRRLSASILPPEGHVWLRRWYFWTNYVAASPFINQRTRVRLLRRLGLAISPDVRGLGFGSYFHTSAISIGAGAHVNDFCYFENLAPVAIGNNAGVGMRTTILTSHHPIGDASRRVGEWKLLPVTLGDGCWIGARSLILAGVTVGEGAVVAAGAVVTTDCEPNHLYGGVPAKLIRKLD